MTDAIPTPDETTADELEDWLHADVVSETDLDGEITPRVGAEDSAVYAGALGVRNINQLRGRYEDYAAAGWDVYIIEKKASKVYLVAPDSPLRDELPLDDATEEFLADDYDDGPEVMTDGGGSAAVGVSRSDAELVYRYARDGFRGDLEADAYSKALSEWQEAGPQRYKLLEDAHESDDSSFAWENIYFETDPAYNGALVPVTGVDAEEEEIRDVAADFAWDYLNAIREEVRRRQASTDYSPREFVALVLDAAENTPEDLAAGEMDISLGNYRGKKGTIKEKLQTAEKTVQITERIRA